MTDDSSPEAGPPDLALVGEWTATSEDRSTKERVYEVVTALTEPTRVATIADRADCSPNGARSNLEWFRELGIVERVGTDPALYRRNETYFAFLRVHRLVSEYDAEELAALEAEYEARAAELAGTFDVEDPEAVDPLALADDADFEAVADRLSEWRAVRRRLRDVRRAQLFERRSEPSDGVPA